MTEERFAKIIDDAVERTAKKFDHSMEWAWKFRPLRTISKVLSISSGIALIIGAMPLDEKGYNTVSKICFITGIVILVCEFLMFIIFRKQ